jgi:hypothetical protein
VAELRPRRGVEHADRVLLIVSAALFTIGSVV